MLRQYLVYILANRRRCIYIGINGDLKQRIHEHKSHEVPGFTRRYNIDRLMFFKTTDEVYAAPARKKQLKGWHRQKKIELIVSTNPECRALAKD